MKISEIYIHPVKSMRGQSVESAEVTAGGLLGDRVFTVMPVGKDRMLTAREEPRMVGITPHVKGGVLTLTRGDASIQSAVPGRGSDHDIEMWGTRVDGADMGDEIAAWLGEQLGRDVRLMAVTGETSRRSDFTIVPDSYVDLAPLLVSSAESLADLNRHLEKPVTQRRFRPNIVVEGLSEPWGRGHLAPYPDR